MLRLHPSWFIEGDGHARAFLLLGAFAIFVQQSSNPNVSPSTHSDCKKHCTMKFLGTMDPIRCPWDGSVLDGNPGRINDPVVTKDAQVLRQVPFGGTCKADEGCIVDNQGCAEGFFVDRPQKRLKKQVLQSSIDTLQE